MKKPIKETKHKPSYTFGDLSTLSTMISNKFFKVHKKIMIYLDKGGFISSRETQYHAKKMSEKQNSGVWNLYSVVVKSKKARKTKPVKFPMKLKNDLSTSNTMSEENKLYFKTYDITEIIKWMLKFAI